VDLFIKVTAGSLITVVLCLAIGKQQKDITLLILVTACCMIGVIAMQFISPILGFINKLSGIGQLNEGFIEILLKSVGIGMIGQIVSNICTDAGNSSLGKSLQLLCTAVILWLSLPLMEQLLELMDSVLGSL